VRHLKQPDERLDIDIGFGRALGAETVASVESAAVSKKGLVAEVAALTVAGTSAAGAAVTVTLEGGTDGEIYAVTVTVTDTAGQTVQEELELIVQDLTFIVPDPDGVSYIKPADYISRFGLEEAVRLTDWAGRGKIDTARLNKALADATAEVDSYIAGRYQTPLATVPDLIQRIAADIARYQLHSDATPEDVRKRYEAAVAALKRVASGAQALPAAEAAGTGVGAPQVAQAGPPVFSRETLEDF